MSDVNPTRRADEPPARDGAPLAGWPTVIKAEEAVALQKALGQLQAVLDAVVRERDEARAEVERLREVISTLEIVGKAADDERHNMRKEIEQLREVIRTIRARCVEMDDSDAVSETLDITSAALEAKP